MSYNTKIKVLIVGLITMFLLGRYGCYYADKKYDTYRRPWAYSSDASKPLLVGKWKGSCTDPDYLVHQVEMEIFVPTTEEERWKRLNQKRPKRNRSSRTFFDGMAVLEVNGQRDSCELWGGLDKADGHKIHFQFRPLSNVHPPGFNLNLLEGEWKGDQIDLKVDFAWFRANGSSFYDSADPRHDKQGQLILHRVE